MTKYTLTLTHFLTSCLGVTHVHWATNEQYSPCNRDSENIDLPVALTDVASAETLLSSAVYAAAASGAQRKA